MNPSRLTKIAVGAVAALWLGGCHSAKDARDNALLTAGVGTMVVLSPLVPVVDAYHSVAGVAHHLTVFSAYKLNDQVYVFRNDDGWFTDQSERQTGRGPLSYSAWVVNLETEARDRRGRIVLSERNLVRWYFRDNDAGSLVKIPRNPKEPVGDYYTNGLGEEFVTLHTRDGGSHVLHLKQN